MVKRIVQIAILLAVFLLGGWLAFRFLNKPEPRPVEEATILLENIRKVCKLVTVEGQFSEIYNYNEYQGYFTWFWDKKALVRVRATVSAGYDLNDIRITADSASRTVTISRMPEPQLLSIDHTLDYYDISNGFFTEFSPQDYNRINKRAKELIREQAQKSSLLPAAREQAEQVMDLIRFMVQSSGWQLVVEEPDPVLLQ